MLYSFIIKKNINIRWKKINIDQYCKLVDTGQFFVKDTESCFNPRTTNWLMATRMADCELYEGETGKAWYNFIFPI